MNITIFYGKCNSFDLLTMWAELLASANLRRVSSFSLLFHVDFMLGKPLAFEGVSFHTWSHTRRVIHRENMRTGFSRGWRYLGQLCATGIPLDSVYCHLRVIVTLLSMALRGAD